MAIGKGVCAMSRVTVFFAAILLFINLPYGFCEEQSTVDWNARGLEAFGTGNYAEARSHFDKAYEVDKKPLYLLNAARALVRQGQYHAAVQYCKRALGVDPSPDMKNKIESLLKHSEQVIKENLTKRTKEITSDQNWASYVGEQQAIEREKAKAKAPSAVFYNDSTTHVSTPERSSTPHKTGSGYTYEEGPYSYWRRYHHRHRDHKERHHEAKERHHEAKDGHHEAKDAHHKDRPHERSSKSHSSGKSRHR